MAIKRLYDTLVGATVNVNQLVNLSNAIPAGGAMSVSDTTIEYTINSITENIYTNGVSCLGFIVQIGHKYMMAADITLPHTPSANRFNLYIGGQYKYFTPQANVKTRCAAIASPNAASIPAVHIAPYASDGYSVGDKCNIENWNIIDLTACFGSTIADYLYSLETATAGAGIAKLKEWGFFTGEYIPYNAGSLESVQATAHVMRDADDNIIGNYDLGTDTLRGLFKLDSNNNLYADGDTKASDGTVTRKYGVVDLGTLDWYYDEVFYAVAPNSKARFEGICAKYQRTNTSVTQQADKTWQNVSGAGNAIWIKDTAYADAAAFKAAMSGVMLVYELAAPTTEQSTPFTNPQICDPDGTEEYTTNNGIPVGHETRYQL